MSTSPALAALAAHCNQHGHIPNCPHGSGGGSAEANSQQKAAVAKIRHLAESASKKAQGARTKEELRSKMPDGKIGQLFSTEEVMLAPVSEKVAEAVKNATGIDVSGRSHAITEERMWHTYSDHSEDSKSKEYPNQKDLTWADFEKLPDIFENYDAISVKKRPSGETAVLYAKSYDNDDYIVVQRVGRKKRDGQSTLNFVTEWVQKMGGRSRLALDAARDRSPSSPTTGSVADAALDVKSYLQKTLDSFANREEEADTVAAAYAAAPAEIMWMPAGTHIICATINGKPGRRRVVVEGSIVPKLNAELAAKQAAAAAHQAARPVVLFDHRQGAAAAFPQRFRWEEGLGIMLELAGWSKAGRAAVEGGDYGYISPSFLVDRRSSRVLGLTEGVEICSLVNDPAFECIHPILDAVAAARAYAQPEEDGADVVGSAHCNQHQHAENCPHGSSGGSAEIQLAHDTTGLQAHLHDEVTPVEITFTPENLNLKQLLKEGKMEEYEAARKRWLNEFKEHYQTQLAGKTVEVEGSGHSVYFPDAGKAKSRAAKGVRTQARAEAGKNMAEAVASSYHLHQGTPEHKEGEGEYRRKMVDTSDSFHVFGCPISINGERSLMWIAATHKKAEANQKNLVFYEFGVADSAKKAGGLSLVQNPKIPSLDKPPTKATLLDVLRDVKSDFQGKPKFLRKEDEAKSAKMAGEVPLVHGTSSHRTGTPPAKEIKAQSSEDVNSAKGCACKISPRADVAKTPEKGENRDAATKQPGGISTMDKETKKKLGLPEDADDAAVDAAVAELISQRDSHKKKAAEAEAECKKKDEALKAARAAEKEDWLTELKKSGRIAPQDEEAISAASALFEADAANARKAYAKIPAAQDDTPVIKAAAANTSNLTLAERLQADFNL